MEEQEILVRGSAEHRDYLRHQFGRIKDAVNSFETRIAVAGRPMLLIYVVYITVRAGIGSALPAHMPSWVNTSLLLLDILMLTLQVLGLEGSVPGLRHLAENLESKGKPKEAKAVRRASSIAQWLLVATAIDIVLQNTHHWGSWDISDFAIVYGNCLFILRVIVIGLYLVAMAKLEHKGPKVISAHEATKQQKEKEQEQAMEDLRRQLIQAKEQYAQEKREILARQIEQERTLQDQIAQITQENREILARQAEQERTLQGQIAQLTQEKEALHQRQRPAFRSRVSPQEEEEQEQINLLPDEVYNRTQTIYTVEGNIFYTLKHAALAWGMGADENATKRLRGWLLKNQRYLRHIAQSGNPEQPVRLIAASAEGEVQKAFKIRAPRKRQVS